MDMSVLQRFPHAAQMLSRRDMCDPSSQLFQKMAEFLSYELCDVVSDDKKRKEVLQAFRQHLYEIKGKRCPMAKHITTLLGKKQTCQVHVWDRKKGRSRKCRNGTSGGHFCKMHGLKREHSQCEPTKRFNGHVANRQGRYCKWKEEEKGYHTSSSDEDSE